MYEIVLVIYLFVSLGVVGLVMLQQGKGADMGASFGAGASNTVFGSSGSGNFLTRMTAILVALFFILSLVLGNMATQNSEVGSDYEDLSIPEREQVTQKSDMSTVNDSDIPH
ncbi:preprotein translocase subunit SecG [Candidatus Enterovibrio escicola]|nr:preprotein translocase subunit SecG [Candidatus Enterovibrio escacola]